MGNPNLFLFPRIDRLPPYLFEEVNRLKAKFRNEGADIIDFGMGNPDLPTPQPVVEKLCEIAREPRTHRYSASRGIAGLRRAQARYYARRFGVKLNPETEVVATLGSKEGFANIAQAISAPGDVVLVPNPTYPLHAFGFIISGASLRHLPLLPEGDFFQTLDRAWQASMPRPKVLVLNYPANPTAQTVDLAFYKEVLAYAQKRDLLLLSDLAYAEIYFDGEPPPSILQLPGAKARTVEFTSMSKSFAMPGWRVGFAVGNQRMLAALARIKSYVDYGAFTPIQVAAIAALDAGESLIAPIRAAYRARRDVLVESFARAGWHVPAPQASMFAWAPLPPGWRDSMRFSQELLRRAHIAVAPGIGFGEHGESHVRIALVENEQRIRQAARNLKKLFQEPRKAARA